MREGPAVAFATNELMSTASFENLDFSMAIESDRRMAYLQEWEDGCWSEPVLFELPQPPEVLRGKSLLARAVRSFRGDPRIEELHDVLTHGAFRLASEDAGGWLGRFWALLQAPFRVWAKETS